MTVTHDRRAGLVNPSRRSPAGPTRTGQRALPSRARGTAGIGEWGCNECRESRTGCRRNPTRLETLARPGLPSPQLCEGTRFCLGYLSNEASKLVTLNLRSPIDDSYRNCGAILELLRCPSQPATRIFPSSRVPALPSEVQISSPLGRVFDSRMHLLFGSPDVSKDHPSLV